jgi:hypothetical protein
MKNNTLKKIGLMILAAGLFLGLMPKMSFAGTPAAPTNLQASVGYGAAGAAYIQLTWEDNSDNETGFCVHRLASRNGPRTEGFPVYGRTTLSYQTTIDPNVIYYFIVVALKTDAPPGETESAPSNIVEVIVTNAVEATITSVTAVSPNQIDVAWWFGSDLVEDHRYSVQRSTDLSGPFNEIAFISYTSWPMDFTYSDTNVTSGSTYYYRIQRRNIPDWRGGPFSNYSNILSASIGGYKVLGKVTDQNDNPLGNITVSFYDETGKNLIASTTTDSAGLYSQVLAAGKYNLFATKDAGTDNEKTIEPNVDVHNPVTVSGTDAAAVNFKFCINCKTVIYVPGYGDNASRSKNPWNQCKDCSGSKSLEIFLFDYTAKWTGTKTFEQYGDDLNNYILGTVKPKGEFTVIAHCLGSLVARAAIIRAAAAPGLKKPNTEIPLYAKVHFIQVAPIIGGDSIAGTAPSLMCFNWIQNMVPNGDRQKWLYNIDINSLLPAGRSDIILTPLDNRAPPLQRQLSNKWLGNGLREDSDTASSHIDPVIASTWANPHVDILNSQQVCDLVFGVMEPAPKPFLVIKSDKFITEANGGKIELILYNLGSRADNVQVQLTSYDPRIKITNATANFGTIETGKEVSNTTLTIELPQGAPKWFFAPLYWFRISAADGSIFEYTDRITICKAKLLWKWLFSSNSPLSKSVYFAKKILNYISTFGGSESVAQEAPIEAILEIQPGEEMEMVMPVFVAQGASAKAQRLESQPVLADLDKDGNLEAIIPVAGRQLRVLKSDGTDFWKAPYSITDSGCVTLYPVAADINNDGELEIVLSEYGADVVRILDKNGNLLHFISGVNAGMPAVSDIDNSGDGKMEIVVAKEGGICAIDPEGRILWQKVGTAEYAPATGAPVLIDLNGDGKKEIIFKEISVLDKDGNILWSKPSPAAGGCAVADLNKDGKVEIISASGTIYTSSGEQWLKLYDYQPEYPPVVADLDNDSEPEVLTIRETGDVQVYSDITQAGSKVSEFSYDPAALQRYPTAIYDMDADGMPEFVLATNPAFTILPSSGTLHFLRFADGEVSLIDTLKTGFKITHTPIIADINKDGVTELIVGDLASDSNNSLNSLAVGSASAGAVFWPQFGRDPLRTGLYDINAPQLSSIGNKRVDCDKLLTFTVSANDELPQKLSFSAYPMPKGATLINNGNSTATFSWKPGLDQAGDYRLMFVVSDGQLSSSEAVSITVISDTTPPTTPVVVDQAGFTLRLDTLCADWSASDPESGIAEYQYRITQDSLTGPVIKDWTSTGSYKGSAINYATPYPISLIRGKAYYFGVKARNGAGLWSEVGYSDGIVAGVLLPPANFTATPGLSGEIKLSWQMDKWNLYARYYELEYSLDGRNFSYLAKYVVSGYTAILTPGRKYYFRIRTVGTVGGPWQYSSYSNIVSAIPPPLTAPTNLTAVPGGSFEVKLIWKDNSPDETSFVIERSTNGVNFTQIATVGSNVTTYSTIETSPGIKNYFRVRANKNNLAYSGYSNTAYAIPKALPAPTNLTVQLLGSGRAKVTWRDNSTDEDGFRVEVSKDGRNFGGSPVWSNTTSSIEYPGVGKRYFRVRAYKGGFGSYKYSGYSNTVVVNVRW